MAEDPRLLAKLLMNAALPLTKVLVEDNPKLNQKYAGWNRVVQFQVQDDPELACHLRFTDGRLDFNKGRHDAPEIDFVFKRPDDFVALMTGKIAAPKIRGAFKNLGTLAGFLPLMLGLTLLMPNKLPKDPAGRARKVKLLLFFITVALSQLNRAGHEEMQRFTQNMPDRIFQWSVQPDGPAAYLRVHRGKTKAGKGLYTRRRAFVHMIFQSTDSAFLVLTGQVDNVEAMKLGYLVIDGSPEYGKDISVIMKKIEGMIS
jgi:hypothetical protein